MPRLVTLVEVPPFGRTAATCLTERELDELKHFMAANPEAGNRIPGTGGVRKLRWAKGSKGKRGGVRVICYYYSAELPLFLLTAYGKGQKEALTGREKGALRKLASEIVAAYRKR